MSSLLVLMVWFRDRLLQDVAKGDGDVVMKGDSIFHLRTLSFGLAYLPQWLERASRLLEARIEDQTLSGLLADFRKTYTNLQLPPTQIVFPASQTAFIAPHPGFQDLAFKTEELIPAALEAVDEYLTESEYLCVPSPVTIVGSTGPTRTLFRPFW